MTRLILIAHAETDATRRSAFPAGESLNARGKLAASFLGGTLPVDSLALTSPAPAARETAWALGLAAEEEPALTDLDVGAWAGRAIMDVGAENPDAASAWIENPDFAGHGGESFAMLVARVARWLAARTESKAGIIAITHAAILRAAAIVAMEAPVDAVWRIEAPPLAQMTLSSDGQRWVLRELRQPEAIVGARSSPD